MTAMTRRQVRELLDELAAGVSDWDWALVRQAVLVVGLWKAEFSANDFRDLLPESAQRVVGLVIRQLPFRRHGALLRKATTVDGYPKTVPSTAASTHGKHLQVWTLTPVGREAARRLVDGQAAA